MDVQLIEHEAFRLVGLKRSIPYGEDFSQMKEIQRFWKQLDQNGTLDHLIGLNNGDITGLVGAIANEDPATERMDYWVAVHFNGNTPEDFMTLELPASKWAVVEVVGPYSDAVPEMWQKLYDEWLPESGHEMGDAPPLEVYQTRDPDSLRAKSQLWVAIK